MLHYYSGTTARNSSHQIAETMALHQTIKAQVEVTKELQNIIQNQIKVTDNQERSIRRLSYAVAFLTLIQTAAAIIQILPNKPEQNPQRNATLQERKKQENLNVSLTQDVRAKNYHETPPTEKP